MAFRNIEEDLSSIHRLEKGEYLITDPQLLDHMVLAKTVRSGNVNLVTTGAAITPELISKLQEMNIETIFARTQVEEAVEQASDKMGAFFARTHDSFIAEGLLTTHEAIRALKDGGRIADMAIVQEEMFFAVEKIVNSMSSLAATGIRDLTQHHQNTTLHSVEVAMLVMQLAKSLNWSKDRVLRAGLAGMLHDVGKAGVSQELLSYEEKYSEKQWMEMQSHALIGYLLLSDNEKNVDVPAFCAGTHHERFSNQGRARGYGIVSNFREQIKRDLERDYFRQDMELAELIAIADVHSGLGEARSYKKLKLPIEIVMIMNLEAQHGKFNPAFYRTWYSLYKEKYPFFLTKGHCFPLPSTLRLKLARRMKKEGGAVVLPVFEERLTYEELAKIGLISKLLVSGYKNAELKRRDGLTLYELRKKRISGIPVDFSSYQITIEKPVNYLLVVVEVLDFARARFLLIKEGDTIGDLQKAIKENRLDPIQQTLLAHVKIELDFSDEVICPV
ncbi:MAG: HD domain-containing protein [Magnetococcus sp. DMHC-6]